MTSPAATLQPAAAAVSGAPAAAPQVPVRQLPVPAKQDALRVATVNIHYSVPDGMALTDENERSEVLDDVASYLREIDADVVLAQEVDDDRSGPGVIGVPEQFAELGKRMNASDAAFAEAIVKPNGDRYGIAVYTRNGMAITDAVRSALPSSPEYEPRNLLAARVATPDGRELLVGNTHIDFHQPDRGAQIAEVARLLSGERGDVVLGGDFNAHRRELDGPFAHAGLQNVLDSPRAAEYRAAADRGETPEVTTAFAPTWRDTRIDHLFTSGGLDVRNTWVDDVPVRTVTDGTGVTDHRAVVVDVAPAQTS